MKKVIFIGLVVISQLAVSCSKDYKCVDSSGFIMSTCNDCQETERETFEENCSLAGGTVQEK